MANDEWQTPKQLLELIQPFGCEIDAAASRENTKCERWLGPSSPWAEDALSTCDWGKTCGIVDRPARIFCNPPYSQKGGPLERWVERFSKEADIYGHLVVALLPATPATRWFHSIREQRAAIFFFRRRIAFDPPVGVEVANNRPRHDPMLVVWSGKLHPDFGGWI